MSQAASSSISSSDTPNRKTSAPFFKGMAAPILLIALWCAFSSYLLLKSGEFLTIDDIIEKQKSTNGLYGSALHQRGFYYKKRLFLTMRPDIIALGSSRVLQFRQEDFRIPFVNMGSMSDLDETIESAAVLAVHKPSIAIIGADFWWFHPRIAKKFTSRSDENPAMTINDVTKPVIWIMQGKIGFSNIRDILKDRHTSFGFTAITRGDGFSADGAYRYVSIPLGTTPSDDFRFSDSAEKISSGNKIFAHALTADTLQIDKFVDFVLRLKNMGVHPVIFMPPLPPSLAKEMSSVKNGQAYAYIDEVRQTLNAKFKENGIPFFDFHDAASIQATDCEFINGPHPGFPVYQRMLLQMAVTDEKLRNAERLADIGWNIAHYSGRATLLEGERDFLGIGCKKGGTRND